MAKDFIATGRYTQESFDSSGEKKIYREDAELAKLRKQREKLDAQIDARRTKLASEAEPTTEEGKRTEKLLAQKQEGIDVDIKAFVENEERLKQQAERQAVLEVFADELLKKKTYKSKIDAGRVNALIEKKRSAEQATGASFIRG